jgi:intracellular septation protein
VVIVATLAQILYIKLRGHKVDTMLWVSLGLVTVLGGATIWFHNEEFIKWKPTGLYWVMGLAFLGSQWLFNKNLLQTLMGTQLELPRPVWNRLNLAWVAFFAFMGALNLWVAFNFSTDTWVNFKLFGGMGLMLVFTVAQGIYISRHVQPEPAAPGLPASPAPAKTSATEPR